MKKKFALLLAGIATVATIFTGCGAKDISGKYSSTVSCSEVLEEAELSELKNDAGLDMENLSLDVIFKLSKDKKLTVSFDATKLIDEVKIAFKKLANKTLDEELAKEGLSRETLTAENLDPSLYATPEEFFENFDKEIDSQIEELSSELEDELKTYDYKGTYNVHGDLVTFVSDMEKDGITFDQGTIKKDGSIKIITSVDNGKDITLVLKPQK